MFRTEGKDGVIQNIGDGQCTPHHGTKGGLNSVICSGKTLVWIFCGLENVMEDYVVISWSCTK
jgi:hypothetical protein